MPDSVGDALLELHRRIDSGEEIFSDAEAADLAAQTAPEDEPSPEPEPAPQAAPSPQPAGEKKRYALDEVELDDPRLPPSLRGRSALDLAAERTTAIQQRDQANFQINQLRAQTAQLEQEYRNVLARLQQTAPNVPPPAPRPLDRIRERVDTTAILSQPAEALATAAEAGAEQAINQVAPQVAEVKQRLDQIEQARAQEQLAEQNRQRNNRIRDAYRAARPADVPEAEWLQNGGPIAQWTSTYCLVNSLNMEDPEAWRFAYQRGKDAAVRMAGVQPQPAPATAPAAPVPAAAPAAAAPAPVAPAPAGMGKPAAAPQSMTRKARISTHQRAAFDHVGKIFESVTGVKQDTDATLAEMLDDPATRSYFP